MKRFWDDQRRFQAFKLLIPVLILLLLLSTLAFAYYQAKYTESAHGDTPNGVNRSSLSAFGYSIGNCAHCHEQHANIGGEEPAPTGGPSEFLLFYLNNPTSQTDNFCFQCHTVGGSSVQVGGITNNDYGSTFGGGTANSRNIKDAFNYGPPSQTANGTTGASHNIEFVRDWTRNQAFGSWITTYTNGCLACHDVHYAQKNSPVQGHPQGGVMTAIRRPSDVNNNPRNQWGDDNITFNETMASAVPINTYQAPVYWPWVDLKLLFEPAGNSTFDGSNLPNYTNFCLVCHSFSITSNRNDSYFTPDRDLNQVNYSGDEHGDIHDPNAGAEGALIYPYTSAVINYRLSCCDCHEPHGSPNPFLLRTCVNGKDGISVYIGSSGEPATDWDDLNFYTFCTACHTVNVDAGSGDHSVIAVGQETTFNCGNCHGHSPRPNF